MTLLTGGATMVTRKAPDQEFGGDWTQQKLELLRKYLSAYTRILSRQRGLKFAYIDAFAGTGYRTGDGEQGGNLDWLEPPLDEAGKEFLDGSAPLALSIDPPFPKLIFIEKSEAKLQELKERVETRFPGRDVLYKVGDANAELQRLCTPDWSKHRAVLFLDPFGMQIQWPTIAAIARTRGIDLWLLVPIGVALNRMLVRDGNIPTDWRNQLDAFFGAQDWYEAFYAPARTASLLGDITLEKTATFETITEYFLNRLRTVFSAVATTPALLRNSKGNPLYALFFAAGNPKGSVTAVRIANDILRKFNHG
jgi:three-Cys-motif partner protein